jgi:hypothetical protein
VISDQTHNQVEVPRISLDNLEMIVDPIAYNRQDRYISCVNCGVALDGSPVNHLKDKHARKLKNGEIALLNRFLESVELVNLADLQKSALAASKDGLMPPLPGLSMETGFFCEHHGILTTNSRLAKSHMATCKMGEQGVWLQRLSLKPGLNTPFLVLKTVQMVEGSEDFDYAAIVREVRMKMSDTLDA